MRPRIVSLVPNATEILFALGAGDAVVAVSHECDYPPEARLRPQLTKSALPPEIEAAEIDRQVSTQIGSGKGLYALDETAISRLKPDLIVTQTLCPVCAVSTDQVDAALEPLASCPEVVSLDPKTLEDVFADVRTLGRRLDRDREAEELIGSLKRRLDRVKQAVAGRTRIRVVALEWLDPPFIGGHWVPEMIAWAGGEDVLGNPGVSSARSTWEAICHADPDCLIVMPCGFDEAGARDQMERVKSRVEWQMLRAVTLERAVPVDANGCFSRPGPRLVEGIETLARVFHRIQAEDPTPPNLVPPPPTC